jgi:hypothetical protein
VVGILPESIAEEVRMHCQGMDDATDKDTCRRIVIAVFDALKDTSMGLAGFEPATSAV